MRVIVTMSNLENLHQINNSSPFDGIRHIDNQGQEYWTARELMPLLGYSRWNEFKPVIERAILASKNTDLIPRVEIVIV